MSEITEWVRDYVAGDSTYETLLHRLTQFEFADPWRNHPEVPIDPEARNAYFDDHVPDIEGTLLELRDSVTREGLPWEVYRRLRADLAPQ